MRSDYLASSFQPYSKRWSSNKLLKDAWGSNWTFANVVPLFQPPTTPPICQLSCGMHIAYNHIGVGDNTSLVFSSLPRVQSEMA